jgi:DNA-directed RNA polymerase subunit M/transcription elongation factor TFIIS
MEEIHNSKNKVCPNCYSDGKWVYMTEYNDDENRETVFVCPDCGRRITQDYPSY